MSILNVNGISIVADHIVALYPVVTRGFIIRTTSGEISVLFENEEAAHKAWKMVKSFLDLA